MLLWAFTSSKKEIFNTNKAITTKTWIRIKDVRIQFEQTNFFGSLSLPVTSSSPFLFRSYPISVAITSSPNRISCYSTLSIAMFFNPNKLSSGFPPTWPALRSSEYSLCLGLSSLPSYISSLMSAVIISSIFLLLTTYFSSLTSFFVSLKTIEDSIEVSRSNTSSCFSFFIWLNFHKGAINKTKNKAKKLTMMISSMMNLSIKSFVFVSMFLTNLSRV